jgi:hemerythrin-like domain-containing protein
VESLLQLLDLHKELDDLFLAHQRSLLRMDPINALRKLEQYEDRLLNHIHDEEQFIIPLYRDRVKPEIGGAPEIFSNEHVKIRTYVQLFKAEMPKLLESDDIESDTLFLLDSQNTYKRLLVHHDVRERRYLYAKLDQVTTASERAEVFGHLYLKPSRQLNPSQMGIQHFTPVELF